MYLPKILYVDDEPTNLNAFRRSFGRFYDVRLAASAEQAIAELRRDVVDVVLSDQQMPGVSGVEFLRQVAREFPDVPRCVVTVQRDLEATVAVVNAVRVFHYFTKPWDETEVRIVMDKAVKAGIIEAENRRLLREVRTKQHTIARKEARFRTLFEASPDGTLVVNDDGTIELANTATTRILGYSSEELVGELLETFIPDWSLGVESAHKLSDGSGRPAAVPSRQGASVGSVFAAQKGGFRIPLRTSLSILREGRRFKYILTLRDVRVEREAQARVEATERALQLAEQANQAKGSFLACMSHEIRTPLNAVLGFAQLLQREPSLSSKSRRQVEEIERGGRHLLRLISEILEMSKIEAGEVRLSETPVDPIALVREVIGMFEAQAAAKSIVLRWEGEPEVSPAIIADGLKMRQVIINLVSNAVKFTRNGEVVVAIACAPAKPGMRDLRIEVRDTGPGIPLGERQHIFEKFGQGKGAEAHTGTGLGLAISREYARLMGGDVSLESEVGVGSCFRLDMRVRSSDVSLPPRVEGSRKPVGFASPVQNRRVLIVDDVAANREILGEVLGRLGFECTEASTGEEAIERFSEHNPPVLFMDLRMPGMDGWEAMGRIRGLPGGEEVVMIALTASLFEQSGESALRAGANAYITKPYAENDIVRVLETVGNVAFLYDDGVMSVDGERVSRAASRNTALRSAKKLPRIVARQLESATMCGDQDRIIELAKCASDPTLTRVIIEHAEKYEYEQLLVLLSAQGSS